MSNMEAFNKIMSEIGKQLNEEAITAIKAALEVKDEPVIDESAAKRIATALGWEPKRKPLTDEQVWACLPKDPDEMAFARAIERAHHITGDNK